MILPLCIYGLNHRSAPLAIRERLAFRPEELPEVLQGLLEETGVEEALILSTCNRVEVWALLSASEDEAGEDAIRRLLARQSEIAIEELSPHLFVQRGKAAVRHIFRVACSLDSMVLGESQILGQVKDAASLASDAGSSGALLGRCTERAFKAAKLVRTETRLGASAVSIASAAVELARKIFGDLGERTAMLVGAGEMAELAALHLHDAGGTTVEVLNRSPDRAIRLAERFGGRGHPLSELSQHLHRADIVISSTGAPDTVLGPDEIGPALRSRRGQPMFLIDIAVPRDIDIRVGRLDNVFLYDIDDLDRVVDANLAERKKEAVVAERIVEREVDAFLKWQSSLSMVPLIVSLRETVTHIQKEEVDRTLRRLGHLPKKDQRAVEAMAKAIVNKILHTPLTELKRSMGEGRGPEMAAATRRLFGLGVRDDD